MRGVGGGRPHLEVHHVRERARETAKLGLRNRGQFCLKRHKGPREEVRRVVVRERSRLSRAARKAVDQDENLLVAVVHRLLLSTSALRGIWLMQLPVVTISP